MSLDVQGIGMTSRRARNRLLDTLRDMGIESERVLEVISNIPRHLFVDEALASRAYENTALPIGHNQTISQPYIVARMTEALLEAAPVDNVLEIGTGCGYQTAVLAQLSNKVFSIERIDALIQKTRERMQALKLYNIRIKYGDGNVGWPDRGPFDGIIVTAAPLGVPKKLLEQLTVGGRLVIPVGKSGQQQLLRITHTESGFEEEMLDSVSFVPMLDGKQ